MSALGDVTLRVISAVT